MKNDLQTAGSQRFKRKALTAIISSTIFSLQAAHAAPVLEEVIVTSTKNMQNLQTVPQAITAFTTDDIDKQGFVGIDEYAKKIPALAFSRREPGGTAVVFRGVATSIQAGTNSSSSVYIDEQPITADGTNANPRMIDIERLEALSGPQGTLFGDASQSGALRIITNKADPSGFSAWVEGDIGYVEHGEAEGGVSAMVNIPISDRMAVRLVGFSFEEAGYIDNVLQDSPSGAINPGGAFDNSDNVEDNINSGSESGARAALHWDINDEWLMDAMVVYQKTETDGFGDTNLDVGDLEQVRYNDEFYEDEWYQIGLTLEGDLGFATAIVSASYFDRESSYQADTTDYINDFQSFSDSYQAGFNAAYPAYATDMMFYDYGLLANAGPDDYSGAPRMNYNTAREDDRLSIEARLQFEGENSDWDAIVGVFYNEKNRSQVDYLEMEGYGDTKAAFFQNFYNAYFAPSLNGLPAGSWGGDTNHPWFGVFENETTDMAIFGEGNYDVTEDFTVTVGGRWYDNEIDRDSFTGALSPNNRDPNRNLDYVNADESNSVDEDGFVGKLGVRYSIDYDKMVYATYSEGFRNGGANLVKANSAIPGSFKSDFLKNYEAGFKTSWMDNRLRVNAALYHMVWEDIQLGVSHYENGVFSSGVVNFAEAVIDGIETEVIFAATEGLEISLTYAYIEAEISEDDTIINDAGQIVAEVTDGSRLPIAPDQKGSLGIEYSFKNQWFGMDPYVKFDYSYTGNSVSNLDPEEAIDTPHYEIMDIAVGMANDVWRASLKLENLEDKRAVNVFNTRYAGDEGAIRSTIVKPRNLTLTVRRSF